MSAEDLIEILKAEMDGLMNFKEIEEYLENEIEYLKENYMKKYNELKNKKLKH
jgi:flagellar motor component MotA